MRRASRSRATARLPVPGLREGDHPLGSRAHRYLTASLRLGPGDPFIAFDPAGGVEAPSVIVAVTRTDVVARVGPLRPAVRVAPIAVTWVQGVAKGDKMDAIVRDATELGATCIIPAVTEFTVVKLEGGRRDARLVRWQRIAEEAARQCGRGDAPEVRPVMPWSEALLSTEVLRQGAFCLYERATLPLAAPLIEAIRVHAPLVFAVGAEGGLSVDEVKLAVRHGFRVASLGGFILRTETVAAAALGAVRVLSALAPAGGEKTEGKGDATGEG
jgi:16S rRNA (uracil1498-N3)-methyltransferase